MIGRTCEVIITVIDGNDKKSLDLNKRPSDSVEDFRKRVVENLNGILPTPEQENRRVNWQK